MNNNGSEGKGMDDKKRAETELQPAGDVETRRRWLKALVASGPVVASVASRPVLAARSCTESGQLSGNTSGAQVVCAGEGCSASFWRSRTDLWHPNYPPNAFFDAVFGTSIYPGYTLEQVINFTTATAPDPAGPPPCNDKEKIRLLAEQGVAALQNAATSVKYDLTVPVVINSISVAMNASCFIVDLAKSQLEALNNQGCPL